MDKDTWFNNKKIIQKSKKSYAHFDLRTNITKVRNYITQPEKIAHHGFYPFIKYKLVYKKFSKEKGKEYVKERIICYAAHIDRCIYQYYSALLNEKYNLRLKQEGINLIPVAYRTNLHCNNIEIFHNIVKFIKNQSSCYIMIGDFTDFFDKIDHLYLKKQLCNLLEVNTLTQDYYAIFKSVTQYNSWELKDILNLNHLKNTKADVKKLNTKNRILSRKLFKMYRKHIHCNKSGKGIPQGSPISACLANIYMLELDKKINDFVQSRGGMYRRYSDDFVIILPIQSQTQQDIEEIIILFDKWKKEGILELQSEKTQVFKLNKKNHLKNIGHLFIPKLNESKHKINFLGFSFDGKQVVIRDKAISKYYYRMRHKAIGIARKYNRKNGYKGSDKLYRLYSERGEYGKGNFLTYVRRVKKNFPNDPIDTPTKNNMVKIRKTLEHYKSN